MVRWFYSRDISPLGIQQDTCKIRHLASENISRSWKCTSCILIKLINQFESTLYPISFFYSFFFPVCSDFDMSTILNIIQSSVMSPTQELKINRKKYIYIAGFNTFFEKCEDAYSEEHIISKIKKKIWKHTCITFRMKWPTNKKKIIERSHFILNK